jgi:hypothetical protein
MFICQPPNPRSFCYISRKAFANFPQILLLIWLENSASRSFKEIMGLPQQNCFFYYFLPVRFPYGTYGQPDKVNTGGNLTANVI